MVGLDEPRENGQHSSKIKQAKTGLRPPSWLKQGKHIMNIQLEEKLAQLRKKWKVTTDPAMKIVIEKQAKLLKLGQAKSEDIVERAKEIFK